MGQLLEAECTGRQSHTSEAMNTLSREINQLGEEVDDLMSNISSVLRVEPPCGAGDGQPKEEFVELVDTIRSEAERLECIRFRIHSATTRLEL